MRRRILAVGFCLATALGFANPARAALLTITDTYGGSNTVWTLDVQTGCTTCSVTLTAVFQDPDGAGAGTNAYTGAFIDSVQWVIGGTDPTAVTLLTAPSGAGSWSAPNLDASLNANQCGGGASNNVCVATVAPGGVGPIANGSTLTWTFSETFAAALPASLTGVGGNIRAAFDTSNGTNLNIFSPDGGTFGTGTGTGTGSSTSSGTTLVPEPTSLLLFGSGLTMAAYRARRKKQNQKNS